MPRKLETDEEIRDAWKRKQERDRKAQAKWVEANRDEHKKRMRDQYQKRKAKTEVEPKVEAKVEVEAPKECAVKEVPSGLSLLDVVKRIRNSYYASMRNKAGWKGKSEEAREQWKKDFVFCDDLISKNDTLLTAEHKAELMSRGISLTDPRLTAKELDEAVFTSRTADKKPVKRKLRKPVEEIKE
jgi:hypothetical protein